MMVRGISCLILLLSVSGCNKVSSTMSSAELIDFVESKESCCQQSKEIGNFDFSLMYKPHDYLLSVESVRNNLTIEQLESYKKSIEGYYHFTFGLRSKNEKEFFREGLNNENEYYKRLEYFVTNAQDDFYLVQGKDSIPCSVYHFERNYGVSPFSNMVMSFKKTVNSGESIVFVYDDKILGVGKIAFEFESKDLLQLPKLVNN